jgi:hypothetical protein
VSDIVDLGLIHCRSAVPGISGGHTKQHTQHQRRGTAAYASRVRQEEGGSCAR